MNKAELIKVLEALDARDDVPTDRLIGYGEALALARQLDEPRQPTGDVVERVARAIYALQPETYITGYVATATTGIALSYDDASQESQDNCVAKAKAALQAIETFNQPKQQTE